MHETRKARGFGTIGYSVMRQGRDDLIHLVTTMTEPCLHFTFNEAWLDSPDETTERDERLMRNTAVTMKDVTEYVERFPDGKPKYAWSAGIASDGRYIQHGSEKWFFGDGSVQYEAHFSLGRKSGPEVLYRRGGRRVWEWNHREDGTSVWTQYWPNGKPKARSRWKEFHAEGVARRWDPKRKTGERSELCAGQTAIEAALHSRLAGYVGRSWEMGRQKAATIASYGPSKGTD